jgi:hypothetical protein
MLRMGGEVPVRAGIQVFQHSDLAFVEAEVGDAAPAGDHFARKAGGAEGGRVV